MSRPSGGCLISLVINGGINGGGGAPDIPKGGGGIPNGGGGKPAIMLGIPGGINDGSGLLFGDSTRFGEGRIRESFNKPGKPSKIQVFITIFIFNMKIKQLTN